VPAASSAAGIPKAVRAAGGVSGDGNQLGGGPIKTAAGSSGVEQKGAAGEHRAGGGVSGLEQEGAAGEHGAGSGGSGLEQEGAAGECGVPRSNSWVTAHSDTPPAWARQVCNHCRQQYATQLLCRLIERCGGVV